MRRGQDSGSRGILAIKMYQLVISIKGDFSVKIRFFLPTFSGVFALSICVNSVFAGSFNVDSYDELIEAVNQANNQGSGVIQIASNAVFEIDEPIPEIGSDIVISGNGVTLKAVAGYHGGVFKIATGGSLKLSDAYLANFSRDYTDSGFVNYDALIDNVGSVYLDRVSFAYNESPNDIQATISLVKNQGFAYLNNTTFYKNVGWQYAEIVNLGEMTILNSTIVDNSSWQWYRPTAPSSINTVIDTADGVTTIGNTLLFNEFGNCWSNAQFVDLGGNFDSDGSCDFDPSQNTVNQEPGVGAFANHGGLVPTLGLEPSSRAIDTGNNDICSATDARFANRPVSGSIHSEPKCDAGAFEYGGAFGNADLSVNGMNGLWFSHASDGHYLHVWRVSPDRVYINWTAFDQSADQMWIYAVADTVGESRFSATAYTNEGGQLVPGAAPEGSVANEWGSVEIELTSCTVGTFRYEANDGAIGSGEFQIDRLAFVEGGGCSD